MRYLVRLAILSLLVLPVDPALFIEAFIRCQSCR
jgi:hypothetical protein